MPTYPRHPLAMAQQALSTQAATDGRLALGIGPSHPVVIETMYGLEYEAPARHTREYVEMLRAAFAVHRQRRAPRRVLRLLVDARRAGRHAGAHPRRRPRAAHAEARGRACRRHHHVLGEREGAHRAHRAAHHPRRCRRPEGRHLASSSACRSVCARTRRPDGSAPRASSAPTTRSRRISASWRRAATRHRRRSRSSARSQRCERGCAGTPTPVPPTSAPRRSGSTPIATLRTRDTMDVLASLVTES